MQKERLMNSEKVQSSAVSKDVIGRLLKGFNFDLCGGYFSAQFIL